MAEKDIVNRAKDEMAASGDNIPPQEPRIYESGYFFLSQQINDLRDRMDVKFDRIDEKYDSLRKEFNDKFNNLQRWTFALIITVVLAFAAIYFK